MVTLMDLQGNQEDISKQQFAFLQLQYTREEVAEQYHLDVNFRVFKISLEKNAVLDCLFKACGHTGIKQLTEIAF